MDHDSRLVYGLKEPLREPLELLRGCLRLLLQSQVLLPQGLDLRGQRGLGGGLRVQSGLQLVDLGQEGVHVRGAAAVAGECGRCGVEVGHAAGGGGRGSGRTRPEREIET